MNDPILQSFALEFAAIAGGGALICSVGYVLGSIFTRRSTEEIERRAYEQGRRDAEDLHAFHRQQAKEDATPAPRALTPQH